MISEATYHVLRLSSRTGPVCQYCRKRALTKKELNLVHPTLPRDGGKLYDKANMAICCDECLFEIRGLPLGEFIAFKKQFWSYNREARPRRIKITGDKGVYILRHKATGATYNRKFTECKDALWRANVLETMWVLGLRDESLDIGRLFAPVKGVSCAKAK